MTANKKKEKQKKGRVVLYVALFLFYLLSSLLEESNSSQGWIWVVLLFILLAAAIFSIILMAGGKNGEEAEEEAESWIEQIFEQSPRQVREESALPPAMLQPQEQKMPIPLPEEKNGEEQSFHPLHALLNGKQPTQTMILFHEILSKPRAEKEHFPPF